MGIMGNEILCFELVITSTVRDVRVSFCVQGSPSGHQSLVVSYVVSYPHDYDYLSVRL